MKQIQIGRQKYELIDIKETEEENRSEQNTGFVKNIHFDTVVTVTTYTQYAAIIGSRSARILCDFQNLALMLKPIKICLNGRSFAGNITYVSFLDYEASIQVEFRTVLDVHYEFYLAGKRVMEKGAIND